MKAGAPRTGAALLAVAAAWAVLTLPWTAGGRIVPWDAKNHFYPMIRWLAARLAAGEWPLWMPEHFAGHPTLSDPQSCVLSPAWLGLALIDSAPSMRAADAVLLGCLLVGGLAVAALALRRGWHPAAAVLAALVLMFGGSAMARLQHVLLVQSYAFLAVALLALEAALDRPTAGRAALAGLAAGLLAVGRDHVAWLGLFLLAAVAVAAVATAPRPRAYLADRAGAAAVAAVAAIAVVAVPVALTLGFAAVSNRPAFDFAEAAMRSLPPSALLTLAVPDLFGTLSRPVDYWGPGSPAWGPPWGPDRATVQLYMGAIPTVLVVWVGLMRGGLLRPGGRLFLALLAAALVYALGRYTPLYRVVFEVVPGADLFRRPADATYLLGIAWALSAGWLAHRVLRDGVAPAGRARRAAEAGAALAVLASAAALAAARGRLPETLPALAEAAAAIAVAVAAVLWIARRPPGRRALPLAVAGLLMLLDYGLLTAGTRLNAHAPDLYAVLEHPEDDAIARALTARVAGIEATDGPVRVEILGLGGAWQNASLVLGVEDTLGYNPLRLAGYETATGADQNSHLPERAFGSLMTAYDSPFARLLGLRVLALGAPIETIDPASAAAAGPPERVGKAWLYTLPPAVPRALFVAAGDARPHDPAALLRSGALPDLDWRRQALIDPLPDRPAPPGGAGAATIVERTASTIDLDVDAGTAGFVVLHEKAFPGWTVTVDGAARPLLRADVLFQAVAVEPGRHRVRFAFRPLGALLGGLVP